MDIFLTANRWKINIYMPKDKKIKTPYPQISLYYRERKNMVDKGL